MGRAWGEIALILLLGSGCDAATAPDDPSMACPLPAQRLAEPMEATPFAGAWRWLRTDVAFGGTQTPQTEGFAETWQIAADSVSICRDGSLAFRIANQIRYAPHPFAGTPGAPDSAYLFFGTTGIMALRDDTLTIASSYVDGNDYWLVRE